MLSYFKKLFGFTTAITPGQPVRIPRTPVTPTVPPASPTVVGTRALTLGPTVAIVNESTVLTDAQVAAVVPDLQIQVDRDFAPVWEIGANLVFVPKGQSYPANAWVIYVLDSSDQAGALGYHDLTAAGMPIGKIFAKDDLKYKLSWTVTLSHELLEMLADPYICYTVFDQVSNTTGTLYALEVADACEDEAFSYMINATRVSDFVYPAWFEGWRRMNSVQFDHTNAITAPFQLVRGGYIGVFAVNPTTQGWTQKLADAVPSARLARKGPYSRTNRRGKPLA